MRPTFDHFGNPVRAAGILVKCDGYTLFRRVHWRYEDMGGKTDEMDACAMDTAIREAVEETDGKLFSAWDTRQQCARRLAGLLPHCDTHYNPRSKYLCYILHVPVYVRHKPMQRFGLHEATEWGLLPHYYQWKRYFPRNLHPRLRLLR